MSRSEIRLPMNPDTLRTWTIITDSPMAAMVELAAFEVMRDWTISGKDSSGSLKSLTVNKARRGVKKAMNRPN